MGREFNGSLLSTSRPFGTYRSVKEVVVWNAADAPAWVALNDPDPVPCILFIFDQVIFAENPGRLAARQEPRELVVLRGLQPLS
jgi:hypothetical protein